MLLKLFCETNVASIEFTYLIVQFAFQMDWFVSGHDFSRAEASISVTALAAAKTRRG